MSVDLQKGLRKISEAQSAVISAQVTECAMKAKMAAEADANQGAEI
ncbi:MAG: hypothetical protein ACRBCT_02900 [Alphaproteobacteria bacterium]